MKTYTLKLSTLSDTIIGSAQSYGTIIDSDIVFDRRGLPYIPAKRIKGLFRNAASDLLNMEGFRAMFSSDKEAVNRYFGVMGASDPEPAMNFHNLQLENIAQIGEWLDYLGDKYSYGINQPFIQEFFTAVRTQTAIDPIRQTAKEHSLRTSRVLKRGYCFSGIIAVNDDNEEIRTLLSASCLLIDRIGSKRNRGFGKIKLELCDEDGNSVTNNLAGALEEKCQN